MTIQQGTSEGGINHVCSSILQVLGFAFRHLFLVVEYDLERDAVTKYMEARKKEKEARRLLAIKKVLKERILPHLPFLISGDFNNDWKVEFARRFPMRQAAAVANPVQVHHTIVQARQVNNQFL
jgi:hypothetical protein